MSRDERTISFPVWPHVISLEGPAARIGALLELLYNDLRLSRDQWGIANADNVGRQAMAQRLKTEGKLIRRLGIATLTLELCEAIELRARLAGVKASVMHLPAAEDSPRHAHTF